MWFEWRWWCWWQQHQPVCCKSIPARSTGEMPWWAKIGASAISNGSCLVRNYSFRQFDDGFFEICAVCTPVCVNFVSIYFSFLAIRNYFILFSIKIRFRCAVVVVLHLSFGPAFSLPIYSPLLLCRCLVVVVVVVDDDAKSVK